MCQPKNAKHTDLVCSRGVTLDMKHIRIGKGEPKGVSDAHIMVGFELQTEFAEPKLEKLGLANNVASKLEQRDFAKDRDSVAKPIIPVDCIESEEDVPSEEMCYISNNVQQRDSAKEPDSVAKPVHFVDISESEEGEVSESDHGEIESESSDSFVADYEPSEQENMGERRG